jgi:hypothetical protein
MTTHRRELAAAEEAGWVGLMEVVSSLTPEQLEEPGYYPDGWSVKDLIAHVGAWHAEAAQIFEQMHYGTYAKKRWDVDALNRQFFEATRDLPISVVKAEGAASRNRMLVEWNELPDISPEADEWFREAGPEHYAEHLPRLREWAQDLRGR